MWSKYKFLEKWVQNNYSEKMVASVGHQQQRSVPRKDRGVERCVPKISRNRRESVLVLEKRWAHGCCHIGFPKSCYDGKHAKVSGVSSWVEVKR